MSNLSYTRQQLESKKLSELKAIALGASTVAADKRSKESWISAILLAQPHIIEHPANPLVEVDGDNCIVNGAIAATIADDDDLTQPWVVKISNIEVHRAATWARCYDYVRTHVKYGTLPNPEAEVVDDYLFHNDPQPAALPTVGESHFIGSTLLRCIEVGGKYAAVWGVINNGVTAGEIRMNWDCLWTHTLNATKLATPQEAVANLIELIGTELTEQELEVTPIIDLNVFAVKNCKTGKRYEVSLPPYSCTCPHWAYRRGTKGFKDKHIDAVKAYTKLLKGAALLPTEII